MSGPSAGEYERIEVDSGYKILPDTMLSPKNEYMYILSEKRVSVITICMK